MIDLDKVKHHKAVEELSTILALQSNNKNQPFFKVLLASYICKIASLMRCNIKSKDRGIIPINCYVVALATSGFGKGTTVNFIEDNLFKDFSDRYKNTVFPLISEKSLFDFAVQKAIINGTDEREELTKLQKRFNQLGPPSLSFDDGTVPAVKQVRDKYLLARSGSLNFVVDEIGTHLQRSLDILGTFLELYDKGQIRQKITKNTNDSTRSEDLTGSTPANLLLFGEPTKLLDSGKNESDFYELLETGYARRCLFCYGFKDKNDVFNQDVKDIYQKLTSNSKSQQVTYWNDIFKQLANPALHDYEIEVSDNIAIKLLEYKIYCEKLASKLSEFDTIKRTELSHRYFKVLKLAGAYSFIDQEKILSENNLNAAIKLVEESGECLDKIFNRERNYVKLVKYICDRNESLTHADLHEALPFYKNNPTQRKELMTLATAYGFKNCMIITKEVIDNIEFFKGERLQETNLDKIRLSISDDIAYNYNTQSIKFKDITNYVNITNKHFCIHKFQNGHRNKQNVIPGFNCLVLDVDGDISLNYAKQLFDKYYHYIYTTKRHTQNEHRFRIMLPLKYVLRFDSDQYKSFINNFLNWIPCSLKDSSMTDISKKWLTHKTSIHFLNYNDDLELLDPIPFIPRTKKNEDLNNEFKKLGSLPNLQRWFIMEMTKNGIWENRNNNLFKYACILKESGYTYDELEKDILSFNKKLDLPLDESELKRTVLTSIHKKYMKGN